MSGDRVALVTGAGRGIGLGIATRLAEAGFTVVAGDVSPVEDPPPGITPTTLDVTDQASVDAAVDQAVGLGELAAVVNCAGVLRETPIDSTKDDDVDLVLSVNVVGTMRVTRTVVPHLREGAAIVNISSMSVPRPSAFGVSTYASSKAAVEAFTRATANELGARGIRVNAVEPGFVRAPMLTTLLDAKGEERLVRTIPLGRLAEPTDIANAVEFLVSPRAGYITGVVLPVDGGALVR